MGYVNPYSYDSRQIVVTETDVEITLSPDPQDRFVFSDLNQRSPSLDPLIIDMDAVVQGVRNLLMTRKGERLFRPEYGSDLLAVVFAPIDDITSRQLREILIAGVERWEPRVSVDRRNTRITPVPEEDGYDILVTYRVPGISLERFQYRGFFERLANQEAA